MNRGAGFGTNQSGKAPPAASTDRRTQFPLGARGLFGLPDPGGRVLEGSKGLNRPVRMDGSQGHEFAFDLHLRSRCCRPRGAGGPGIGLSDAHRSEGDTSRGARAEGENAHLMPLGDGSARARATGRDRVRELAAANHATRHRSAAPVVERSEFGGKHSRGRRRCADSEPRRVRHTLKGSVDACDEQFYVTRPERAIRFSGAGQEVRFPVS